MRALLLLLLAGPAAAAADVQISTAPVTPRTTVEQVLDVVRDKLSDAVAEVAEQTQEVGKAVRRVILEFGGGYDTWRDERQNRQRQKGLRRQHLEKDDDIDLEARLLVRNESVGAKLRTKDVPGWQRVTLDWRTRADVFAEAGLESGRDGLYRRFGTPVKARDKTGWKLGLAGIKDDFWGYSVGFDRLHDLPVHVYRDLYAVGASYSPLGLNDGKVWNYNLATSVNHEIFEQSLPGEPLSKKRGVGFSIGPVFQYGLDWVPIPGARRWSVARKSNLDRIQLGLSVSDSTIHPTNVVVDADLIGFMTQHVRLSVGVTETYEPGRKSSKLTVNAGVSIVFNLLDMNISARRPPP